MKISLLALFFVSVSFAKAKVETQMKGPATFKSDRGFSIEIPACYTVETENEDDFPNVYTAVIVNLVPNKECSFPEGFDREVTIEVHTEGLENHDKRVRSSRRGSDIDAELYFQDNSKEDKNNYYIVHEETRRKFLELSTFKFCPTILTITYQNSDDKIPALYSKYKEKFKKGDLSDFNEILKIIDSIKCIPPKMKTHKLVM